MRPGVDVISRALPPPRTPPTDTGVAFVIGPTASGDQVTLTHSMTEYVALCGGRTAPNEVTYDAADTYFREGGNMLYVASTTQTTGGLTAPPAVITKDQLEAMTRGELDVYAADHGVDPEGYGTKAELLTALEAIPAPAAADPGIGLALAALNADLGPGQVFLADPVLAADVANQSAVLAHCAACNRVGLLSCADGDASSLQAAATALQTDTNARYGALFAPSAIVPGVVAGTTRTVPYAAVEAGIIARNDVSYNPNVPAAGVLGQAVYALDLNGRYSDADYEALNTAGVDMARLIYGGVRTYGYRSLVDPDATPEWLDFGNARLNMAIVAQASAIGERYVFAQIDGRGLMIAQFGGELTGMLAPMYDAGALFGDTPEDAFYVDVGPSVNTPTTIANQELHAVIGVRMSPFAEWVVIEIVKVAVNEALPAIAA
jgi:phage tail sheath protein FI